MVVDQQGALHPTAGEHMTYAIAIHALTCETCETFKDQARGYIEASGGGLWSCSCGWTNTSADMSCQRCGEPQRDGYGF